VGRAGFPGRLWSAEGAVSALARIPPQPWWVNILVGIGFAAAALLLRWALSGFYGQVSGLTILLPGVVLAALTAGRLAGAATIVAALLGGWVIAGPTASGVALTTPLGVVATTNFIVVGLFVTIVAASLRKSVGRLDRSIAELSAADARADESDTRFQLMADTAPSPVWMTNAAAEVEFVNAALVEFYGRPTESILGHVWKQVIHPDDQAAVEAAMQEARPARRPYGFEARFQHADGGWRWMRIGVNPRIKADGTFLGYVGMAFDVSETRAAMDALDALGRRQSFMLDLYNRVRDLDDPAAIMDTVQNALGERLDVQRVGYGELDQAGGVFTLYRDWTRGGTASLEGELRIADFGGEVDQQLSEGLTVVVRDVADDPATAGAAASFEAIGVRAFIAAPIMRLGELRAFLRVDVDLPRIWSDAEVKLISEVADQTWSDVERARAETELRESEARFRSVADTAPVLIWVTHPDRTRAFVNEAYVAFNGGTCEEARLADWRAVIHPDDQERILRESVAGEATGHPFSLEARYLRHDGAYRWLKSFSRPRPGPDGSVQGFVGVAFDVTDIREINARLAASATERDAILGQLAEGVIVTDPDGRVVFVNEAAIRHHGVEHLDVPPDDYAAAYHLFTEDGEPYPTAELPLVRAVLKGESVTGARWRIRRPDGSEVLAVGNARPVIGADGQKIGAVLTLRDETARVLAENRLMESETRFRTVADSAPALIWMLDAEGKPSFVNRRYRTYFGIESELDVVEGWGRLVHPDDIQAFTAAFDAAIERRDRFEGVIRTRHATLGERWLRCEALPRFDAAGVYQGYVGANIDITEAKRAEEDLKRINELLEERVGEALAEKARAQADLMHSQRMEAVGRLTGGVAHDFNNLLTVVIGALDIILRSPNDAAKRQKLGEAALAAARRGEGLTHQLLAFSRRQTLRPQALDINVQLRQSEPLLHRAVGEAVEFKLKLRRGGARVSVDPSQLEAALLNLVVNARDAVGTTGEITIKTSSCSVAVGEVAELAPGDYVCVTVSDNGSGMPPEIIARVFEPFFTTKAIGKGTGLGLSQVYGFARQSGGAAHVTSTVGKGTEIRLYLPPLAPDASPVADTVSASVPVMAAGRRLLLVEDDVSVAAVALELLEAMGLEVRAAQTGPDALDLLQRERFDIMLSDVVMPGGMTGIELARECERRHPDMRIVLTSGYAGEDVDAALTGAPWPFLRKPYTGEQLAAVLGDLPGPPGGSELQV